MQIFFIFRDKTSKMIIFKKINPRHNKTIKAITNYAKAPSVIREGDILKSLT